MTSYTLKDNIKAFQYGNPIETNSIVEEKVSAKLDLDLNIEFIGGHGHIFIDLKPEDIVYGLGGNLGGINKRGRQYESYCTDEPLHIEDREKLYSAHNFFIISGEKSIGYFIDFPSRIKYDIGFLNENYFNIEIFGEDFYIYIIEGDNPKEIANKFLKIIGKSYVPPKWGFGYFQSRWGYRNKEEVLEIYNNFKKNQIPIEGIFLDLDYMDNFKDFSISKEKFDGFKDFTKRLKGDGLYLVPIIDAGVKIEKGYDVYDEGIKGDHFCKDKNGLPYEGIVWPGRVHFPDFLKPSTQKWFGSKYKILTDCGIEGFWNDMNEPAIFYEESALGKAIEYANKSKGKDLDVFSYFQLKDNFSHLANKDSYYENFYHEIDGKLIPNDKVHNLYGYYMTKSASVALKEILEKRFLLISRASSIGMHRYGGIWTGDNSSWWSHLELNIKMLPSLNLCGFYYIGADTGGFGGNANGEILNRWLQLSVFTPLLRNHSAIGCNNQEPYIFSEENLKNNRDLIKARYSLIPYIYSEYMKAINNYDLMFKPLAFEYSDELSKEVEDQILLGNELILAPVYKSNSKGRLAYFPENVLEISFIKEEIYLKGKGLQYIDYGLSDLKFYLRGNSIFPYVESARNTEELSMENLNIIAYVDKEANYTLYDDDGISYDYLNDIHYETHIKIIKDNEDYIIEIDNSNPNIKNISFKIIDSNGNMVNKLERV
jgi:alpha-glucosidase